MAIKFLSGQTITGSITVSANVQAATFNSLAINTTGVNNVANQIVRTESNGYANFGWINSVSGNHTGSITRITASNDAYLRYVTPAQFRTGVTDGFYAPSSTVSGVTSVSAGNGLAASTNPIISTGTLSTVHLPSFDTRSTNPDPEDNNNTIRFDFKSNSTNGLSDGGGYNGQMTWRSYGGGSDLSGGYPIRLAYTANGNLWRQMGTSATSWGAWNKFAIGTGTTAQYIRGDGSIVNFPTITTGTVTSVATGSGLTGGTITTTGTLSLNRPDTQLGAVLATYGTTAGNSGRIRCTAPFNVNTGKMFSIEITIYSSYVQHNYVVSAYMYSTINQWYQPKAIYTTTGSATPDIYVGRDSNGKAYISIANGNYTGVVVHNMTRGYATSLNDTYDPWTITIDAGNENSVAVAVSQIWTTANLSAATLPGGPFLPLAGGNMTGNITVNSAIGMQYGSTHWIRPRDGSNNMHLNADSGGMYLDCNTINFRMGDGTLGATYASGIMQANASMRAPIFYDSNNTGYYLDPQATSAINTVNIKGAITFPASNLGSVTRGSESYAIYQESGSWTNPFPDLNIGFHTGISIGAYTAYNGIRFFNNSDMVTQVMSINNISDGLGADDVYVNNSLVAGSSLRAPIFYDSNNTGYYGDFGGTSNIYKLQTASYTVIGGSFAWNSYNQNTGTRLLFGGGNSDSVNNYYIGTNLENYGGNYNKLDLRWHTGIRMGAQSGYGGIRFYDSEDLGTEIFAIGKSGSHVQAANSVRAPIFYDSNNTTYYTRPSTSSYMNSITTAGQIQCGTGGSGNLYIGNSGSTQKLRFSIASGTTSYFDMDGGDIHWRQNNGVSTRYWFYMTTANMTISGTLTQLSDLRLKENIVEIGDCISKVKAMRGIYYNRTDFNTEVTKVGVIAQEVEKVLPELVLHNEEGQKSVAYAELSAVLINAIKEQQVMIDDLKSRLEILENN